MKNILIFKYLEFVAKIIYESNNYVFSIFQYRTAYQQINKNEKKKKDKQEQ